MCGFIQSSSLITSMRPFWIRRTAAATSFGACPRLTGKPLKSRPKRRRRHKPRQLDRPKGSYRLPTGEIATKVVYTDHHGRRIAVIGVRRAQPDLELLAKAIVQIAVERVESETEALRGENRV